jgi:hypothetical protein
MFSGCGRFIEDLLRNLKCLEKSKYSGVINSFKSIKIKDYSSWEETMSFFVELFPSP